MDLSLTESQLALKKAVHEFNKREVEPIAAEIDREGKLPDNIIKKCADLGLLGMVIPVKYGGAGMDNLSCILACEQLAYSGAAVWWLVAFNNSIPEVIYRFGSIEQRKQYLPGFCDGAALASLQFTEDDTGSDPSALKTTARLKDGYYFLSGTKRFSTFGARDGYAVAFAKDENGECTAFIIKKNITGYSVTKQWDLMGSGGVETVDVSYEKMKLSADDILGKKGNGLNLLLEWIAIEKLAQCAATVGIGQAALDEAIKYTKSRLSRGKPITDMQGIRWMLAEMESKIQAARWLTYRSIFLMDKESDNWMEESASTKLFVVPAMMEVVEMSRRIHGAYGYTKEFKIERLSRAITGASAIAVSLEINKSIVANNLLRKNSNK